MTAPLVPADVDLTDFAFMPFEFGRLFKSETWILSNDAEKVAALTLWGKSWTEVPAGSIPDDDRMLAHLSGAGPRWKRLKAMALRGWVRADDGRMYHPVVCEKVLEAWYEKLSQRLSSGAGNAKRWGIDFDPTDIEAQIIETRRLLKALNPDSRMLSKRKPPAIPPGSRNDPTGIPGRNPPGIPSGSQETGTGIYQEQEQKPPSSSSVAGQPARPHAGLTDDDDGPVPGEQDLPSWIPRPLWREFYRHRAVLRKPLSIPGQRQVVRRLVELSEAGHDIAASLRQTMAAGLVIPVTPKDPDHANVPASRKLSAVDQVAAKIRERREREHEHADNEPPFATLGHG